MRETLDLLFVRKWWSRDAVELGAYSQVYSWFNLAEALAWFVLAALVFRRCLRFRNGSVEIAYAVAFFVFGVTDVVESYALWSWLIWWKLVTVIVLFVLRRRVLRAFYPGKKLF